MNEDRDSDVEPAGDGYELDELLGAYALDAVDADERARVEDYLRINPRAVAEVRDHREVATMLAFTGMDAPPDLWSKIAAEIDEDAPAPGEELAKVFALDPATARGATPVAAMAGDRPRRRTSAWFVGAAAAVVTLLVGAVVVLGLIDSGSDDPIAGGYEAALDDSGSLRTELVAEASTVSATGVIDPDGHGYVDAAQLPRLEASQTYQLWGVLESNGDVVSLGILGGAPELETFTVHTDVVALAITIEDAPGVDNDGNPDGAFVGAFS